MVKKINTFKIKHQSSIIMFVRDYANLIKRTEQIQNDIFLILRW